MIHTAVKILQDKGATDIKISSPLEQDSNFIEYKVNNQDYKMVITGLEELQNNTPDSFYSLIEHRFMKNG